MSSDTATARSVTLTIPGRPAYSLSPNSRVHWRTQRAESKHAKYLTTLLCRDVEPIHGPVRILWGIHLASRRKFMDRDNATATLKPFMDGLVEAGIIDGDTPDIVTAIEVQQLLYKVDHTIAEGEIDCVIQEATP